MSDQTIVLTKDLPEGESLAFSYRDDMGLLSEGFVIRRQGRLYAYRNVCRHQPLTLDYGDGDFFTEDKGYLLCRNHGALFTPETGLCVSGPCAGASLFPLTAVEDNGAIQVTIPPTGEGMDLE
jgi:nitrite reductase/ring-hydroxylating ferredoxin subunit